MTAHRFPFAARAAAVEAASATLRARFEAWKRARDDAARHALEQARSNLFARVEAAYPPGFWDAVAKLRKGDPAGLDEIVDFLEADPIFYRSGYVKEGLIRCLKRLPLGRRHEDRLRQVVLSVVRRRDAREFRHYCRLARRLDSGPFRAELAELAGLASGSDDVARRARWVLDALDQGARTMAGRGSPS